MKISISGEPNASKGGRQGFLAMLAANLSDKHSCVIVGEKDKSDIHLNSISGKIKKGSINVLRIDGIYYDKERLSKNKSIVKSAKEHDHVVFQSEFSKINFEKLTNNKVKNSVIFNGTERRSTASISDNKMIACSAKWRVNKRLEGLVEAVAIARKNTKENIKLKVIGDPDCSLPEFCINTGHIDNKMVQKELSGCQAFAHICHIESCPNSVVEALVCGLPVLCNNIGGTMELVSEDGIISNIDKWDWTPISNMNLTKLNHNQIMTLSNDLIKLLNMKRKVVRDDLLIENSAARYYKVFKDLLS